jgi:hypothetical protein
MVFLFSKSRRQGAVKTASGRYRGRKNKCFEVEKRAFQDEFFHQNKMGTG